MRVTLNTYSQNIYTKGPKHSSKPSFGAVSTGDVLNITNPGLVKIKEVLSDRKIGEEIIAIKEYAVLAFYSGRLEKSSIDNATSLISDIVKKLDIETTTKKLFETSALEPIEPKDMEILGTINSRSGIGMPLLENMDKTDMAESIMRDELAFNVDELRMHQDLPELASSIVKELAGGVLKLQKLVGAADKDPRANAFNRMMTE